jgi:hypothetical protein
MFKLLREHENDWTTVDKEIRRHVQSILAKHKLT